MIRPPYRWLPRRERDFGVPISLVHEIVRMPDITEVPETPDFVEGVINLRGKIISVVDLRKRFRRMRNQAATRRIA